MDQTEQPVVTRIDTAKKLSTVFVFKFKCVSCGQTYSNAKGLTQHEFKTHFSWMVKPYNKTLQENLFAIIVTCCRKGSKFDLREKLNQTLDEFENNYDDDTKCIDCDFVTQSRQALFQHYKANHVQSYEPLNVGEKLELESLNSSRLNSDENNKCDSDTSREETYQDPLRQDQNVKGDLNLISDRQDSRDSLNKESEDNVDIKQEQYEFVELKETKSTSLVDGENQSLEGRTAEDAKKHQQHSGDNSNSMEKYEFVELKENENHLVDKDLSLTGHTAEDAKKHQMQREPWRVNKYVRLPDLGCGYCAHPVFKDSPTLVSHVMAHHFRNLRCHLCGFDVKSTSRRPDRGTKGVAGQMGRHMMTQHRLTLCGKRGQPCPHCHHICLSLSNLKVHIQRKHPDKPGGVNAKLKCSMCKAAFATEKNLENHVAKKHSRVFRCDRCPGVVMKSEAEVSRHLAETVYHIDPCLTCGLPVPAAESREGAHQCPVQLGPKQFDPKESFKFSALDDGGCLCHLCGFTSSRDYTMLRHKTLMHKPQKCPCQTCKTITPNRSVLQEHIRSQHPEMCCICGFESVQRSGAHSCVEQLLLAHLDGQNKSTNVMVTNIDASARPGACTKCFNIFPSSSNALRHMKTCSEGLEQVVEEQCHVKNEQDDDVKVEMMDVR